MAVVAIAYPGGDGGAIMLVVGLRGGSAIRTILVLRQRTRGFGQLFVEPLGKCFAPASGRRSTEGGLARIIVVVKVRSPRGPRVKGKIVSIIS